MPRILGRKIWQTRQDLGDSYLLEQVVLVVVLVV